MVVLPSFAFSFVVGAVTFFLVPVVAGNTMWVKSGKVIHKGLHMGESSSIINSNISQLSCTSSCQELSDGSTRDDRKHKCLPNLILCFDFLWGKSKYRKDDQTPTVKIKFHYFNFFFPQAVLN